MLHQQRHVFDSVTERGDPKRHDVQSIEEVRAESTRVDLLFERLVRGGDHPHVDLDDLAGTDALELPLLKHAEQLRLHLRGHVTHLVEKERPVVRALELAVSTLRGAREGAGLVSE